MVTNWILLLFLGFLIVDGSASAELDDVREAGGPVDAGACLYSPATTHLTIGQYADFHTNSYPLSYTFFEKCSWKFETTSGARLSLSCDAVYLSWFTDLYVNDGDLTVRVRCFFCFGDTFEYDFVSTTVEIGLQNWFIFSNKGFSCRISAVGVHSSNACNCGVPNTNTRIVGGKEAGAHQYPWTVALVIVAIDATYCGGSLITDQFAITAAHCTSGVPAHVVAVRLGSHKLLNHPSTHVVRMVKEIISHPNYDADSSDYDLSLLRFERIDFSSTLTVRPICLPSAYHDYVGSSATVAGWGKTSQGGLSSPVLLEVDVPVISNFQCQMSYGGSITDRMICAGDKGLDACQGDSGGGLWVRVSGGYSELIGVVSFGYGCGKKNYPGVYTRITSLVPWIIDQTARTTTCSPPS